MSYQLTYDEKLLLARISEGDESAFRRIFEQYHQRLGAHIFRITRSYDLAEEVVQDVFLKIWMTREALSEVDNFSAYLFVVSRNQALNLLKKMARERLRFIEMDRETLELMAVPAGDPEVDYGNLIDEAINALPAQQQKVYLMSRHERFTYFEIATRLGISRETVKKYLQLAIQSITTYIRNRLITIALAVFFTFF